MQIIAQEWAVSEKNQHKSRRKSRYLGPDGKLHLPLVSQPHKESVVSESDPKIATSSTSRDLSSLSDETLVIASPSNISSSHQDIKILRKGSKVVVTREQSRLKTQQETKFEPSSEKLDH
ncbi:hypothetical protein BGZ76_010270 [Entomortierella beljakovae]|nr:hypothetical protein BGZ76_010270 [Entomortierella beljakovae]